MVRAPPLKTPGDAAAAPLGQKPSSPARATPHPLFRLWACVAWSQDLEWVTSLRRGGVRGGATHSRSQVSNVLSEKPCQGQRDIYMTLARLPAVT